MNETERKTYLEQFNRRTHVLGRIVSAITLVLLVGAPFLIGTFLGAMPDLGAVAKGALADDMAALLRERGWKWSPEQDLPRVSAVGRRRPIATGRSRR